MYLQLHNVFIELCVCDRLGYCFSVGTGLTRWTLLTITFTLNCEHIRKVRTITIKITAQNSTHTHTHTHTLCFTKVCSLNMYLFVFVFVFYSEYQVKVFPRLSR